MVDTALVPAIKEAIKQNEIGNASPYRLSYARLAKSGASFGIFQGDTNVNHTARAALAAALRAGGADEDRVTRIIGLVSQPCPNGSPLSPEDAAFADDALASTAGRQVVDAMDGELLQVVLHGLDTCIAAAEGRSLAIQPVALLYMALWINMTGPPGVLSKWLGGSAELGLSPPIAAVSRQSIESYLHATSFFTLHPKNFVHLQESVKAAVPTLPSGSAAS